MNGAARCALGRSASTAELQNVHSSRFKVRYITGRVCFPLNCEPLDAHAMQRRSRGKQSDAESEMQIRPDEPEK